MLHAGLDLSRRRLEVCLLDAHGELVAETAAPPVADGLRGLTGRLAGRRVRAVIESMNGARFVHDTLEELGWEVLIADAQKVKGLAPLFVACGHPSCPGLAAQALECPRNSQLHRSLDTARSFMDDIPPSFIGQLGSALTSRLLQQRGRSDPSVGCDSSEVVRTERPKHELGDARLHARRRSAPRVRDMTAAVPSCMSCRLHIPLDVLRSSDNSNGRVVSAMHVEPERGVVGRPASR